MRSLSGNDVNRGKREKKGGEGEGRSEADGLPYWPVGGDL